ncbi:hypothetical protein Cri9333_4066 [Crinalium epipsammum PCC 9333]|uniref:Uncharacterized protein n=1 Tax=Crinalium epipsammum PCC 9333 TaxID=1173022 RepID=K9W5W8_9CYAN|nr:hypothetical protein [Crinalium epipsammum]AFZ14870.1 hypothetical protein Cri9333_4066 [Crinalium epipsammum PCC 9333]
MANDNSKNLYEQVINNIYPQIKGRQKGLLYKIIQIIFCEEQSFNQEKTREICDYFGIRSNADKDEDKEIINNLVDTILINNPISTPAKWIINFQGENMEWIFVAAAFTFVGLFWYKQNLEKNQQQKTNPNLEGIKEQPISPPISVDLCLVVPASIARNFVNNKKLSVNVLTNLIDNASYLLCTADSNKQNLELTDEDIATVSEQREVYIRIGIDNGKKMIGEKVPYILKSNLPPNGGTVKELACLEYLSVSGLENFNRV